MKYLLRITISNTHIVFHRYRVEAKGIKKIPNVFPFSSRLFFKILRALKENTVLIKFHNNYMEIIDRG